MSNKGARGGINAAGQWLRAQRERRGINSQAELARRLGWDKAIVNNYETGRSSVPDDRAEQLADFFGLDIIEVRRNLGLWVPPENSRAHAASPPTPEQIVRRIREDPEYRAEFFEALLDLRERGVIGGDDESD